MEVEDNSGRLLAIRILLGLPLSVMIISAIITWNSYAEIGSIQWYFGLGITLFLCFMLIMFMLRATVPASLHDERTVEYYIEELQYQEQVFVIPTICTHCKTPIQLNQVRWEDEHTLHCQECQAEIKLRIIEK